jgi:hypothetical protein
MKGSESMNLVDMITHSNELADEQEAPTIVVQFVNDAIAQINIKCDANFPNASLNDSGTDYVLPEKWVRTLIIPFTVGRLKQKDSSQFEYTDAYVQFIDALAEFKTKYTIPDIYKDADSETSYPSDIYEKPPVPWQTW